MKIQLSDHFTYRRVLRFALPSILMMIFTSIYVVVDGFFVSNFAGKNAFAAVSFIYPFIMILGAVGFMLGTGGTALIALRLGAGYWWYIPCTILCQKEFKQLKTRTCQN